jgi:hypothetical protein
MDGTSLFGTRGSNREAIAGAKLVVGKAVVLFAFLNRVLQWRNAQLAVQRTDALSVVRTFGTTRGVD